VPRLEQILGSPLAMVSFERRIRNRKELVVLGLSRTKLVQLLPIPAVTEMFKGKGDAQAPNCPGKHGLANTPIHPNSLCNDCGKLGQVRGKNRTSTIFSCWVCKFHVCENCYNRRRTEKTMVEEEDDEKTDSDRSRSPRVSFKMKKMIQARYTLLEYNDENSQVTFLSMCYKPDSGTVLVLELTADGGREDGRSQLRELDIDFERNVQKTVALYYLPKHADQVAYDVYSKTILLYAGNKLELTATSETPVNQTHETDPAYEGITHKLEVLDSLEIGSGRNQRLTMDQTGIILLTRSPNTFYVLSLQ